ncbi:transglutaminase-like domain-containing protein [Pedobacter sp. Leaf132]|uniref:transglutaminase-like domain-containing protein n=1 Tax=Pedobacter sp. Leaf132 TaxID=2876557 RepID=UPI001E2C5BD3|nr:transglutaminase-like domain-containing protein [Pedobacter sp. Leaf132]
MNLKLDSVAGKGNELSKIFNLMHWVHNLIRHDGSSDNPTLKNAIELVKVCREQNRGVNCRMLATVLNECYLALGITSRYITCMPRETNFDDCHVINMVYSKDLSKWIWIDPTFDSYVMDEKGTLLGIKEVRERLIKGQPLVLNADANWNRTALQSKEYYLQTYMAKNLYRLETPVISQYDTETWTRGKEVSYVELLPLDGIVQGPQKRESSNPKTGVKFIHFKTNNPELFWTTPK